MALQNKNDNYEKFVRVNHKVDLQIDTQQKRIVIFRIFKVGYSPRAKITLIKQIDAVNVE